MNTLNQAILLGLVLLIAICIPASSLSVSTTGGDGSSRQTVSMKFDVVKDTAVSGTTLISGANVQPTIGIQGAVKSFEQTHSVTDSTGKHAEVYAKVVKGQDVQYKTMISPKEGILNKAYDSVSAEQWLSVGPADYIKCSASGTSANKLAANVGLEMPSGGYLTGYDGKSSATAIGAVATQSLLSASGPSIIVTSRESEGRDAYSVTANLIGSKLNPANFVGTGTADTGERSAVQDITTATGRTVTIKDTRKKGADQQTVSLKSADGSFSGKVVSIDTGMIIQDMMNLAENGDSINIGPGIYTENLFINKPLTIEGAGMRKTIIDGGKKDTVITNYFDNVVLSGVSIQNGKSDFFAGGVENSGTMTIKDSLVTKNTAQWGGGIENYGTLNLIDTIVSDNTAEYGGGGGIYNQYGTLNILRSIISNNKAVGDEGYGGGIASNDGIATIKDSAIISNTAGYGGGIVNSDSFSPTVTMNVENTLMSGNVADTSGGGIYNWGNLAMKSCIVSGNKVLGLPQVVGYPDTGNGGGIYNFGYDTSKATLNLDKSYVFNNNAKNSGGGIYNNGVLTQTSSKIFSNKPNDLAP